MTQKGFVDSTIEKLTRLYRGTGLGISTLLAGVSLAFLLYPTWGLLYVLGFLVAFIPLVIIVTVAMLFSNMTLREIDQARIFLAFISLAMGVYSLYLAWVQDSMLWVLVDAVSLILTIRFIVMQSDLISKPNKR